MLLLPLRLAVSVLLLQGVAHCVAARRDSTDAQTCMSEGRAARRRASQPRNWMRVTPSPAAEGGDVAAHVWPELRGLSPSKQHDDGTDWQVRCMHAVTRASACYR